MPNTVKQKPQVSHKVLVVEDEGELGLVLDMILNDKQLELDYVSSLLDASEYLQKQQPSLIILDNKLPDGFGVDFISYIRKNHPGIRIIMISGFATVKDVALENGADIFFEKPFPLDEFNKAIDRFLRE